MTPGSTEETVDGMSQAKIEAIIDALRQERYRWRPARRTYIEKKGSSKKRPLGLPTWSDKLLQEVIRLILEAYYEPQFSDRSHGFRPKRGCHTALSKIQDRWNGTTWFIEGDISDCFGSLDHEILISIFSENIHDNRFLRLIGNLLKAGYLEDWKFNKTLSGSPQGGIVSPILSNIYLDRLDRFVEQTLLPTYNHKSRRRTNPEYRLLRKNAKRLRTEGQEAQAKEVDKQSRKLPSRDPNDPDYRRLRYIRYADDFLLGFSGPRDEAEEIKQELKEYMHRELKLELSQEKTLITHARSEAARFLGYEIVVLHEDNKLHRNGQRNINGCVGMKIPADVVRSKCAPYRKRGKPVHRPERLNDSVFSIISQYQQEYRGIVEYYRLAYNLSTQFKRLKWVMETSLTKTLAHKLRISVNKVYKRYKTTIQTEDGPYKVLKVEIVREGKKPLVAQWGGISLARNRSAVLNDNPPVAWNHDRTEVLERLLANVCELCGSTDQVQVHHIRALKDLQRTGRAEKPEWVKVMSARRRKSLIVCQQCHSAIHAGKHSGKNAISG
jgi:group II intron reverse transcriptase/maturase